MRAGAIVLFAAALLAACSQGESPAGDESDSPPEPAEGSEHIACAVDGESEWQDVCAVERVRDGDTLELVVRHPGGGFRRFLVTTDGRGLVTADGAQELALDYDAEGFADVQIGGDRYRFPASRRGP